MQTKPKANSIITHEQAGDTIKFLFRGSLIGALNLNDVSSACRRRAEIHGFVQRIGDGGAVERMDKQTGHIRTEAEMDDIKRARIITLIAHYNSGAEDWNLARSTGGGGVDNTGLTLEAMSRVYGWPVSECERKVDALAEKKGIERKEMLRTYANIPDVAAMMGTIKAERAARTGLDVADLMDELQSA